MSFLSGIVPARFLIIMAHLIVVSVALWGKHENVESCLPMKYKKSEYDAKNHQLTCGLVLNICFLGFELISFMSGISIFWPFVCFFSILAHTCGTVTMSYFLSDQWDCDAFWYIFSVCVVLPLINEAYVILATFVLRKGI